jgi:SAM-dependent methyltransferase
VTATLYDAIRYTTYPRLETHPDRLAAVASLRGMRPAPVARCRVLEIACGDGGNLVPLAYFLPGSRFTGIDLAASAVAEGCAAIDALELTNIAMRVADLRDLRPDSGQFDYIIAHGLYSWVPPDVRDRLIALCSELLAPYGVAYVSYNVWPGRRERHRLREVLLERLRDVDEPAQRIARARVVLASIDTSAAEDMARSSDDILFHDDLAPVNDPVTADEFDAHAARHGLQYLGEAGAHAGGGFRQSLLCRAGIALSPDYTPDAMDAFHFSLREEAPQVRGDQPVEAVVGALGDAYPLPLPFAELEPYAGGRDALREILFSLVRGGAANVHVHDFPCQETVTKRPRATRLARYQAARSRFVTSVIQYLVELTEPDRKLLQRLDGRRKLHGPAIEWMARMGLLEG